MTAKQEILAITELAFEISELQPQKAVHSCSTGAIGLSLTVFNENNDIEWQENVYEWACDEAYLPKLRFIRHTLEQIKQEALAERQEQAA